MVPTAVEGSWAFSSEQVSECSKAELQAMWNDLGTEEKRELMQNFQLGDAARDDFFLKILEEDCLQRQKLCNLSPEDRAGEVNWAAAS